MSKMTERMGADEMVETLTGYDEIAVEKAFGKDLMVMGQASPTGFLRALAFVAKRREGLSDKDAKEAVLNMPLSEVNGMFETDDEPMPDDPVTDMGKGGSLASVQPMISPDSAS